MQTHTYKNGFRLVYEHLDTPETSIHMYCDFGSIHEPEDGRGAAHFIEHMCFKGTKALANTRVISTVFDKSGSFLNAFTDRRTTCYYVNGTATDFAEKINTLCDMMLNSVFNAAELNKEHNVVREEMHKDADDAELIVYENIDKQLFSGSTYARPVDKLEYHTHRKLSRSQLYNIYKNTYIPSNFILSICSSLRWAEVKRIVDASLMATAPMALANARPCLNSLHLISSPVIETAYQPGLSTTHLCVGFRTCGRTHEDMPKLLFAATALGSTMNARMFFVFREKHGISYTSTCDTDFFENFGAIRFYVECDTKKFVKAHQVMRSLISDLVKHGLTLQEFNLTRGYLKGQMELKARDPSQIASYNGELVLHSELVLHEHTCPYSNFYQHFIEPLSLESINNCLKQYLIMSQSVTSVVSSDRHLLNNLK